MVRNMKVTGRAMAAPVGIGAGTGIAVAVTILGALVVAWMTDGMMLPEDGIGYGAMVTLLLASCLGARVAAGLVKRRRLLVCMATGGVYLLLLLGMTAFFFGGQYQGVAPTARLALGGALAAAMVGNPDGGRGTKKRHKFRTG